MTPSRFLKSTARQLFALERDRHRPLWADVQPFVDSIDEAGGGLNIPELLELLADQHDQPAMQLRATIRRLIVERHFACESGDSIFEHDQDETIEAQVDLVVRVLERVRQRALHCGEWSEAPVTPQMFG